MDSLSRLRTTGPSPIGPDNSLTMDMNGECLERNLRSFGLQRDVVPGNGNCCFASIAKEVNKLVSLKGNEIYIMEFIDIRKSWIERVVSQTERKDG